MNRNLQTPIPGILHGRIRWAGLAIAALLVTVLARPVGATPAGAGTPPPAAPATAYTLRGDANNNSGTGNTTFSSPYGSSSVPTWIFGSTSQVAGTRALRSYCQTTSCIGFEGEGQGRGVNGIGIGDSAFGVIGTHDSIGGTAAGVRGITYSTADSAKGVEGIVAPTGAAGDNSVGVIGLNTSTSSKGIGVWGSHDGSGWGVYGVTTGAGRGVYGESAGTGVYGYSSGTASTTRGVYGAANSGTGVRGFSSGGTGVQGSSTTGTGGSFSSSTGDALHASTSSIGGYAITTGSSSTFGSGSVYIDGNLTVTGNCCSTVATDAGDRQMYATEATRHTFTDEGTATLVAGHAVITLDPLFAQAANLTTEYQVFLTPHSADTPGLAAVNLTPTGFEVREFKGGSGSFKFSWRVDAVRKGYEQVRMEAAPAAPAPFAAEAPDAAETTTQGGADPQK